ncbi:MAG TPA: chemotaxis protein CheW, partial [Candidatus Saccharimonadales bacterium]|nr:chemotaxis protein CheW [Candidatus Saccharimonadales bacterium]
IEHVTPVPNSIPCVEGVVFSRGQVIPVVNLRARFGFARENHSPRSRLMVVRSGERVVGLIVDAAREFRSISTDQIQPPSGTLLNLSGSYLAGTVSLGERLVLLLDLQNTLNFSETLPANLPAPVMSA